MSSFRYSAGVGLVLVWMLIGCSSPGSEQGQTLSLLVTSRDGRFQVKKYEVLDRPFKEQQQQGLYQVHLLDKAGNILQKISFEKLSFSASPKGGSASGFYVALPLKPALYRIRFYRLDGSSGHYQLKADAPLLSWKLPGELTADSTSMKR